MGLAATALGVLMMAVIALAGIPPPYLPGNALLVGEFLIPSVNVTGSQRIYLQYAGGASLAMARIDEVFSDVHDPSIAGLPRYDSGFVGNNSYYASVSATGGLSCHQQNGILSIIPQQTWFLLFCSFNGTTVLDGAAVNLWACSSSSTSTTIWYTDNLYGTFLRMEYYSDSQPQAAVLVVNWTSITPYQSLPLNVFAPPTAWNCTTSSVLNTGRDVEQPPIGALGWALKLAKEQQISL